MVFSLPANSRRSAENNRCPCISLSLTPQRFLILSAETVSYRSSQRLAANQKLQSMIESFHTNIEGTVQLLQALWHPQRQTSVHPSPNALWNLCPALETRLWHRIRGNLSADQVRWQAFPSWPPQSQDKGSWSPHQRHAVHQQCSSGNPPPEPRLRFVKPSPETCCSPTMQQWQSGDCPVGHRPSWSQASWQSTPRAKTKVREALTRDMLFANNAAAAIHPQQELHAPFLSGLQGFWTNHQSQENQRPGGRIQWNCQPSSSMTMSLMLNSSDILAPPSLTTSLWTQRSIRGFGRQPQHLPASFHQCGPTVNWQWKPGW